jgi:site-specific DNA-cytosine methylase
LDNLHLHNGQFFRESNSLCCPNKPFMSNCSHAAVSTSKNLGGHSTHIFRTGCTLDIKVVEFFSGLGGWRYALGDLGRVISAFDVSEVANRVYRHNFGEMPQTRELATISSKAINELGANTWLMSPPCQPFCRMGRGRGLEDPRSAAFVRLMDLLTEARPERFVLENVEGFLESDAFDLLARRLNSIGMKWRCLNLCPTQFGIPNRRPRVFVVACVHEIPDEPPPSTVSCEISNYLDAMEDESLYLSSEILARHAPGMDIVLPESCRSACFIGGYGKRLVDSGSFLQTPKGVRRFSPRELCRLLGYPHDFCFPPDVPLVKQYRLLGNGLNLVAA